MPIARWETLADELIKLLFCCAAWLEGEALKVALKWEGGDLKVSSPDLAQELYEGEQNRRCDHVRDRKCREPAIPVSTISESRTREL